MALGEGRQDVGGRRILVWPAKGGRRGTAHKGRVRARRDRRWGCLGKDPVGGLGDRSTSALAEIRRARFQAGWPPLFEKGIECSSSPFSGKARGGGGGGGGAGGGGGGGGAGGGVLLFRLTDAESGKVSLALGGEPCCFALLAGHGHGGAA